MSGLVLPHGSEIISPLFADKDELPDLVLRAGKLRKLVVTKREANDIFLFGMGAYNPLKGFIGHSDWISITSEMKLVSYNNLFWPIPITLSADKSFCKSLKSNDEIALCYPDQNTIIAILEIEEQYKINKDIESKSVYGTNDIDHPGVKGIYLQKDINLSGNLKVISYGLMDEEFKVLFQTPIESRKLFEANGWDTVAALQIRNPMHRSHEHIAKIALEVVDGLYIHQILGKPKPGDIPVDVRMKCVDALTNNYFVKNTVIQGGLPLEMRYAGPKEALLHAIIRQNYGCSHFIIGRDYAGIGTYYNPFEAQDIFDKYVGKEIFCQPLKIDWTFWCSKCNNMASLKTCPHKKEYRLLMSGTMLRKKLTDGKDIPIEYSRPEVLEVLKDYYSGMGSRSINSLPEIEWDILQ